MSEGEKASSISVMVGGEAGYGIMTSGEIIARSFSRGGLHVHTDVEYPSLIRGGHNTYQVVASDREVHGIPQRVDVLIALDQRSVKEHVKEVGPESRILFDLYEKPIDPTKEFPGLKAEIVPIPLANIVEERKGDKVMRNTVAIGACMALIDYDFSYMESVIRSAFAKKDPAIADANVGSARAGYEFVVEKANCSLKKWVVPVKGAPERMLLTGNDAIALGALQGGVRWYSAYPMTPASSILHFMAANEKNMGLIVRQTEDEIAAATMAIGANHVGVRAMTATSGGGFCLMTESVGLAAMSETPMVYVLAQRPGPSTGLATRHEQGDLQFALDAAQGDFVRVVLAPGDVDEAFYHTFNALNLAERYQIPVILISDRYLSESFRTTIPFNLDGLKIDRGKLLTQEQLNEIKGYRRYQDTDDGVSPRALPGMKNGLSVSSGDDHNEMGETNEEPDVREKLMDKRFKKLANLVKEIPGPILYGPEDADATLVTWGSAKGPCLDAMELLKGRGRSVNLLHFVYLRPFPRELALAQIRKCRLLIDVEGNRTSQLERLIREELKMSIDKKIRKYDGRPFFVEPLADKIEEVMR
ncbi:MAG TPA: 2-oxoacid:acceptor oxidoreductase subunit alpha [Thermoplasmata archaeon]|nr:2-oxoacid:acceptor oxidoreductase subunit alpha [Thermoplasmata archaeon]